MIHIVFGATAIAGLKLSFEDKGHQIIGFPVDFSVGPISNIHTNNGLNHYFSWLESSFQTKWNYLEEDRKFYEQGLYELLEIKDGDKVTIWTCENAAEQIGLRICCFLLKGKQIELGLVNSFKAMHDYKKNKEYRLDIRHTGECNLKFLKLFYKNAIRPITNEMRSQFEHDGEVLLNSKSYFRIWRQGKIIHVPENIEDPLILECARRIHKEQNELGFINATRLVGEVFGESPCTLSDAWIEYRVRSLVQSDQLAYEGDLKSMQTYKIRVIDGYECKQCNKKRGVLK